MTQSEIDKFIDNNTEENIKYYFDKLVQNLQLIKSENYKMQIWMLLVVGIYFSIDLELLTELKLGPIKITTDNSFVTLFTPLVFTFLLMQFATINSQRALILKNIRMFGSSLFSIERNIVETSMYTNQFLQIIMPFSMTEEVYFKFMKNGKMGCLTMILALPLFIILLAPLYFEYIIIRKLLCSWSNGWFDKVVIVMTIWFIVVIAVYYIKLMAVALKESKADLN